MRRALFSFGIFISVFVNGTTVGAASLSEKIERVLKPFGKEVSLSVRSSDGAEVVAVNSNESLSPASVAKMISTSCALKALGPEFQFETLWGYRGKITNGVLDGDLVIRGSGDFSYVIEDLKEDLEVLRVVYGLKEIKGKLVFDGGYLASEGYDISDEFEGDQGRAFHARLTALPFNFNAFSVWILPTLLGVEVTTLPKGWPELSIVNRVKRRKGGPTEVGVDYQPTQSKVIVEGIIDSEAQPKVFYRSVPDPYESFAKIFSRVWRELGGVWTSNKYAFEKQSAAMTPLWSHRSRAVSRLVVDINKLSTNFGAEMLLLAASARQNGSPTSPAKAKTFLDGCIQNFGLSTQNLKLENASGLSRQSKVKASAFTQFLSKLDSEYYFPEYLSSLSVLGKDGTTKRRLAQYAGKARLKTGSLRGVKSMAGYIYRDRQKPMSMALFFNCERCSNDMLIKAEDAVLSLLFEN